MRRHDNQQETYEGGSYESANVVMLSEEEHRTQPGHVAVQQRVDLAQ